MGAFDQAARHAAQAAPEAVIRRLLSPSLLWRFREWLDTHTLPLPGGPDRTADLVAALDDPASSPPWLLVFEFQAQHDPDKLDVTLEEAAILRGHARHGKDRKGKYRVLTALVYLQGDCPEELVDMTVVGGYGTRHAPLLWNVGQDEAATTLEAVVAGESNWGMLFWVPLMRGGGDASVIARWKEVVATLVEDRHIRGNLAGIALVFAELVGRRLEWKRGLEDAMWTESQVVNEWIGQGFVKGRRESLLEALKVRFPESVTADIVKLITEQDSPTLLNDWFRAALRAESFEQFLTVVRG
jgi:hypothetical protein